ncbi:hypothetical protein EYZ11_011223 [Aspergillus tanneri]|uniref:Uncharacterized protein n=1 Tax=Aspergillus tanneri TaxID=1220188 RepID=A0A4S3J3B3_9EURO|nr:hypothetical protein EYZ11_011223 [Aspergillus tanneri]
MDQQKPLPPPLECYRDEKNQRSLNQSGGTLPEQLMSSQQAGGAKFKDTLDASSSAAEAGGHLIRGDVCVARGPASKSQTKLHSQSQVTHQAESKQDQGSTLPSDGSTPKSHAVFLKSHKDHFLDIVEQLPEKDNNITLDPSGTYLRNCLTRECDVECSASNHFYEDVPSEREWGNLVNRRPSGSQANISEALDLPYPADGTEVFPPVEDANWGPTLEQDMLAASTLVSITTAPNPVETIPVSDWMPDLPREFPSQVNTPAPFLLASDHAAGLTPITFEGSDYQNQDGNLPGQRELTPRAHELSLCRPFSSWRHSDEAGWLGAPEELFSMTEPQPFMDYNWIWSQTEPNPPTYAPGENSHLRELVPGLDRSVEEHQHDGNP